MSDDLKTLTDAELNGRNIELARQRQSLHDAQDTIQAELDRRQLLRGQAALIASLPDDRRAAALTGADPELSRMVGELAVAQAVPPAQTIAPVGIEPTSAVGTPGSAPAPARRRWRPWR